MSFGPNMLAFGEFWAFYKGPFIDNARHSHAALQIAFTPEGKVVVELQRRERIAARALLIKPATEHRLIGNGTIGLIYVQPLTPLSMALLGIVGDGGAERLPKQLTSVLCSSGESRSLVNTLEQLTPKARKDGDSRVLQAMRLLGHAKGSSTLVDVASACGLSASHLRALVRSELGFSLSTWIVWKKLERAVRSINNGRCPADAALDAGFSDQSHLTRTMHRMLGITPGHARATFQ